MTVSTRSERTRCVTMFSGGRDSTLTALRLLDRGVSQTLVTVTSSHLRGLSSVHERLLDLRAHLPGDTIWVNIEQPPFSPEDAFFTAPTCFPCHKEYSTIGVSVAEKLGATALAFGYASYQSDWPEQTPRAVAHLRKVLEGLGLELFVPVYDVASKEEAREALQSRHVSTVSLEQKCSVQVKNIRLEGDQYDREFKRWCSALGAALARRSNADLTILDQRRLDEVA